MMRSMVLKINGEITTKKNKGKKICPFIKESYKDCYITNMVSRNTESVIYYCGGNFEECAVYKSYAHGNKSEAEVL